MRTIALVLLAAGLGLQSSVVSSAFQFQHGRREIPSPSEQNQEHSPVIGVGNSPYAEIPDRMERERRSRYFAEQHSHAMIDARRLAQLARELEADLDQADGLTLPATSIKKADEIVKLAKSVKNKMRAY
jgi:hypothetical protein